MSSDELRLCWPRHGEVCREMSKIHLASPHVAVSSSSCPLPPVNLDDGERKMATASTCARQKLRQSQIHHFENVKLSSSFPAECPVLHDPHRVDLFSLRPFVAAPQRALRRPSPNPDISYTASTTSPILVSSPGCPKNRSPSHSSIKPPPVSAHPFAS